MPRVADPVPDMLDIAPGTGDNRKWVRTINKDDTGGLQGRHVDPNTEIEKGKHWLPLR